ncbi:MAG: CAP domain-containing protein [Chthoniobacter sp.]|nr:CAP domain-containing protein [Chthoniobacter sp.]
MKFCTALLLALAGVAVAGPGDLADEVQAEINLARTAPQEYARIVAREAGGRQHIEGERVVREAIRFLEKASPLPPLRMAPGLQESARSHVSDQGPSGGIGHRGDDGSTPWKRMTRFGSWSGRAAENIAYGRHDARGIVVALIVDDGVRDRGHRQNIFGREFRCAGIATGPHARYGTMCVIDFAAAYKERADELAENAARAEQPFFRW